MAAGRFDCELRSAATAVGSLFANADDVDGLFANPYRTGRKTAVPPKPERSRETTRDAVFDAVDDMFLRDWSG